MPECNAELCEFWTGHECGCELLQSNIEELRELFGGFDID